MVKISVRSQDWFQAIIPMDILNLLLEASGAEFLEWDSVRKYLCNQAEKMAYFDTEVECGYTLES